MSSYYAEHPTHIRLSVSAVVWRDAGGSDGREPGTSGPEGREILLMRRSDNGCWGLPGGYVDRGESVSEAAVRELREETGVEAEIVRLIGVYSDPARQVIAYPDGNRVQAVNLCFEARAQGQGQPTTPEETLEIGYFSVDALPEPFVPIHVIRIEDAAAGGEAARVR